MIIVSAIILFITVCYAVLIFLLLSGFRNLSDPSDGEQTMEDPFISVVIPFRNESKNLPDLLDALREQSLSSIAFEVIFIDDHSEDSSAEIITKECTGHPNYCLLSLAEDETGKKAALAKGINRAAGPFILQTDGDVWFGRDLLKTFSLRIRETGADLIAGPVSYKSDRPILLNTFETIDHFSLTGVTAGSFYFDNPLMCSGANLCYRKSLYEEARQYDPVGKTPSGDDMFLLIGAKKLQRKTDYLKSRSAIVYTRPSGNLGSFIRQRFRWGSKVKFYKDPDIVWVAVLVSMTNLTMLMAPFSIFWFHDLWKVVGIIIAIKSLADFLLLHAVARFMKQTVLLWFFPVIAVLYYFYFVYIAIASLFSKVEWKGRSY